MKYKLVAFDMDGTLVEEYSSWGSIHQHFGTAPQALKNLEAWDRGEIDYPEFMRRDTLLWGPQMKLSQVDEILSEFNLMPGAPEVTSALRERGYHMAILTGGLSVLAERVADQLGIEHILANGLEVDERGYLTGEGIFRVDPLRKYEALEGLAKQLGFTLGDCVAVADSKYDVSLFEKVGMGIAIGDDETLAAAADAAIGDLKLLLDHL